MIKLTDFSKKIFTIILIISGILCALLQSSLDIPLLAFVSFAPVMYALQKYAGKGKREFVLSFIEFFLPYYFTQTIFLVEASRSAPFSHFLAGILLFIATLALTLLLSVITFIPVYTIRWLKRNPLTDMIFLSALITMGDFLSQHIPLLSFPWSSPALCLTSMTKMIQSANIFGSLFVSFVLLLCNGLMALLFSSPKKIRTGIILVSVAGINFAYGCFYENFARNNLPKNTINVMCVQDNAEGDEKAKIKPLDASKSYLKIMYENISPETNLVILPETPILEGYYADRDEFRLLNDFAKDHDCVIISGCFLREGKSYNSQYAIRPDGSISNFYCKQVLVPFGERNPIALLTGEHTLSPGTDKEKLKPLECGNYKIGCAICIESIYPEISKSHAKNGAGILCVSTNDSWFGNSGGRVQHFRHCILRSVENSRYLVRAGNCGISAVISPMGKIIAKNASKDKGVVKAVISDVSRETFYTKTGELYVVFPTLLMVIALARRFMSYRGRLSEISLRKKSKRKS